MIDEKRLDAISLQLNSFDHLVIGNRKECIELLSLAKLGLWAREKGIPALKSVVGFEPFRSLEPRRPSEALAALPDAEKEKTNG